MTACRCVTATGGVLYWLLVAALGFVSPAARAQDATHAEHVASARALFAEGRELAARGDHERACPKFEEALRLHHGMGTQFNLADCWEHVGKTASAWALFLEVAAAAKATDQFTREAAARERAKALEPRLSYLVIRVAEPQAEMEVWRGSVPLGRAAWGAQVPVDPGEHQVRAEAPGFATWQGSADVSRAAETVELVIPALKATRTAALAEGHTTSTSSDGSGNPTGADVTQDASASSSTPWASLALGGVGLVGLGAGAWFGLRFREKNDDAKSLCVDPQGCGPDEIARVDDLREDARGNLTRAWIGVGVGAAALAGAAVLWTSSGSGDAGTSTSAGVQVQPTSGGLALSAVGTF